MNYTAVIAVIVSFGISAIACPAVIPFLKRLKFGQQIREEGPRDHRKKSGTPTMGGLAFLFSIMLTCLFFVRDYPRIIPIMFVTLGFGVIGFLDDYIKVVMKRSEGLNPLQKLFGQTLIAGIFCFFLMYNKEIATTIRIPFMKGYQLDPGWFFIPLFFVTTLGTDNGVNLTDGLDGLCASVTVLVAIFVTVVSCGEEHGIEPVSAAVAGSLLGFLLFNVHPAKMFMGDTGSLALGGFVISSMFMMQMPLFILIIGFVYLLETVSVILQVGYFKLTKGKRLFRMAPIHHHFELGGWSETRVVTVFSIVTALMCLLGYIAL